MIRTVVGAASEGHSVMWLDRWRLVRLLRRASELMNAAGDAPYIGEFDTCFALGQFLEKCVGELAAGNDEHLQRLWYLFAPTCDWDDAGGSQDIGNAAYGILNRIGRPVAT